MDRKQNRKLIKEGKALSTYKMQKLAGILLEGTFEKEVELSKKVAEAWLKHAGEEKIKNSLTAAVGSYLEDDSVDVDEDGVHYSPPQAEYFVNGSDLFDEFYDDIADFAEQMGATSLLSMFENGDLPGEVEEAFWLSLEQYGHSIFDDIVDDIKDGVSRMSDAHSYYGVSPKDFF